MSEIRVGRRGYSLSFREQIVAYRKSHSMKETMTAFNVCHATVKKYAPTTTLEHRMRMSIGMRNYHQRRRDEIAIRKALIQPELDEIDRKIAELQNRKTELLKTVV